jgi:hypothetical protein
MAGSAMFASFAKRNPWLFQRLRGAHKNYEYRLTPLGCKVCDMLDKTPPASERPPFGVYDPARDGFPNSRLMHVAGKIARMTTKMLSDMAYGTGNPRFCAADAADDMLEFGAEIRRQLAHYEAQARAALDARAIEARRAETAKTGSVEDESAVA